MKLYTPSRIPFVFLEAARRKNIINDSPMHLPRTRLIFDSIMVRLVGHNFDDLCRKFGGPRVLEKALIPCVDMLVSRVEGLKYRYRRQKPFWMKQINRVMTWSNFRKLETEILKMIDFEIYKEGIDEEYEEGELSLWVRHGLINTNDVH
jgi:hypothetical protein